MRARRFDIRKQSATPTRVRTLGALAALLLIADASARPPSSHDSGPGLKRTLTLAEARSYLLELINKDRAAYGLNPVALDEPATKMAQEQSERMVTLGDISHSDLDGRLPPQRYTEAGGRDRVRENVIVCSVQESLDKPIELDPDPTFTPDEIERIEAAYFNEVPPNDGHRRNILRPEHTHVGIGFARGRGKHFRTIGNAQEFVDRYAEDLSPLPSRASVGDRIVVVGRLAPGRRLTAVGLSRGPLPRRLSRPAYQAIVRFTAPEPYVKYRTGDNAAIEESPGGRFAAALKLDDGGRAGLYYVSIWIRDPERGEVLSSLRTVVVEAPASTPAAPAAPKGKS